MPVEYDESIGAFRVKINQMIDGVRSVRNGKVRICAEAPTYTAPQATEAKLSRRFYRSSYRSGCIQDARRSLIR